MTRENTTLEDLPPELLSIISGNLDQSDAINLSLTNSEYNRRFFEDLTDLDLSVCDDNDKINSAILFITKLAEIQRQKLPIRLRLN